MAARSSRADPAQRERGSVAVEMAVVAPALVALMLLVVAAGRISGAEGDVRRATAAAARAASLRGDPRAAEQAALNTVAANLTESGVACNELRVDTAVDAFRAGGSVAVTVRCTASLRDVSLVGLPGSRTFSARSVEVIDRYRGGG